VSVLILLAFGMTNSREVKLLNATPEDGIIGVKYQMLCVKGCSDKPGGDAMINELVSSLPETNKQIPEDRAGLRVIAMQYRLIKTSDHWYALSTDKCGRLTNQGNGEL